MSHPGHPMIIVDQWLVTAYAQERNEPVVVAFNLQTGALEHTS